jgi:hypothetical protein
MPGSYTITYSVTNDNGIKVTVQRTLIVYQAAQITTSFVLYSSLSNATAVQQLVQDMTNVSTAANADAVQLILGKLGQAAAAQLDPSDIQINSADVVEPVSNNFTISANVSIFVFSPAKVHKKQLSGSASNSSASGSSRRLLSDDTTTSWFNKLETAADVLAKPSGVGKSKMTMPESAKIPIQFAIQEQLGSVKTLLQMLGRYSNGQASSQHEEVETSSDPGKCWPESCHRASGGVAAAVSHRHLLQDAGSPLQSSLSSLTTALTTAGASNTSSAALTNATVDLQAVSLPV